MDDDLIQFSRVLGGYRLYYVVSSMGMTVYFSTATNKSPHPGKMSDHFCTDDKEMKDVAVPESWELNQLQRRFIDSMINKTGKQ